MDDLFTAVGKVAGLAGLCIGLVLVVFRDVIRKQIFPRLPSAEAYRLLRLIIICTWSVAIIGIVLWVAPTIVIGDNNKVLQK